MAKTTSHRGGAAAQKAVEDAAAKQAAAEAAAKQAAEVAAAKKAAEDAAAKKAAEDAAAKKAAEDAAAKKAAEDAPQLREFAVLSTVLHDGQEYPPGASMGIDRATFLPLRAAGAIDGEWPI